MTEPTVLDYVKSIFKDWKSFSAFLRAWADRADTTSLVETSTPVMETPPASEPLTEAEDSSFTPALAPGASVPHPSSFPWRSLLALIVALLAQRFFEPVGNPPTQNATLGVPLYLAAFALAGWAFLRGEWTIATLPPSQVQRDLLTVRGLAFLASMILGVIAFFLMSGNMFTALNLTVWLAAVALFLYSVWLKEPQAWWKKLADSIGSIHWDRRTLGWLALILGVIVLTLFFRFYRLSTVPPEMTSDHAEKLLDVFDITNGKYSIFFPRNTGREPLYIYLSAWLTPFFGVSFLDIKVAAVIGGLLMLPYLYLLGKELGSERIGLLAVAFTGVAYWANVIERFALRISFYPLFVAPTLYYLIRGLRTQRRNDFILAGLMLGLGLNGYTPFRIMPLVVVAIVLIYLLHVRDAQARKQSLIWLGLLALTSMMIFIPLGRYASENPEMFSYRALSRLGTVEQPLPGPAWQLFLGNLWNALKEFNWNNGGIWVHSIPNRPALDIVSGALFLLGSLLVLLRYLRLRHWTDLTLLLAVPMTQMPSILSLAFPSENPSLNRTGGAIIPVFLLVGIGLDGLMTALGSSKTRRAIAWGAFAVLLALSSFQNYDLVFYQYNDQYTLNAWNTKDMGNVMKDFIQTYHAPDNVWIVPYPFWVDTRLPPFWAGLPGRDIAIAPDHLADTLNIPGPKLFMAAIPDVQSISALQALYPNGQVQRFASSVNSDHDFWIFTVPPAQ